MQSIEDFPYTCRRLRHEQLEGCEDLWLDDEARVLYAACSGSVARTQWNSSMSTLNISGRRPGGSELMALNIDCPGEDGLFGMHSIKPVGYEGATGNGTLDLVGFDVEIVDAATLCVWLINQRPPVDASRKVLDSKEIWKIGVNATIDIFQLKRGEKEMCHVMTVAHPAIYSLNNLAFLGNDSFVISNDHSGKIGLRKELDMLIGGGNIVYCSSSRSCYYSTTLKFWFLNGLVRGKEGLIYVPSAISDDIKVMKFESYGNLREVDSIKLGMPVDNLAVDAQGDIYAAGLPKGLEILGTLSDPFGKTAPSSIWRIQKTEKGYETKKVLEDRDKKVLSGVTTARHDVKTGRLFLGAAITPYMMVCDPK